MHFSITRFFIAAAISLCGLPTSWAQESGALATVSIAGHPENARGTLDAASQGVLTAPQIAARPALRVAELLEFIPGMMISQHSGEGKANQYFLRGFNLDHGGDFAIFVDGMPAFKFLGARCKPVRKDRRVIEVFCGILSETEACQIRCRLNIVARKLPVFG